MTKHTIENDLVICPKCNHETVTTVRKFGDVAFNYWDYKCNDCQHEWRVIKGK